MREPVAPGRAAAVTDHWKAQFAAIPAVHVAVSDGVASGDEVVAHITYTGTHTTPFFGGIAPTGRPFWFGTLDIRRVGGGKVVEHRDQVDFAGSQRQLTARPATP